jgi:hypothetical protein
MRRFTPTALAATLASTALALTGLAISPAAAADEWLYVLASDNIRIVPGSGDAARVILRPDIDAVQFTDRPERASNATTTRTVLRDFGWTPSGQTLPGKTPNAAISISTSSVQVVEIRRASIKKSTITFFVRGLNGPVNAASGAGAVFIDDASGEQSTPLSPSLTVASNYNPQGPAISVSLQSNGITLWSGTVSPSAPSVTVPSSSAGTVSVSGQVEATFTESSAQVLFSGSVYDSGQVNQLTGVTIGNWSDS